MHGTTWMNLENITLNERLQNQKNHVLYDSTDTKCPE